MHRLLIGGKLPTVKRKNGLKGGEPEKRGRLPIQHLLDMIGISGTMQHSG